jgi:hypothetical protein
MAGGDDEVEDDWGRGGGGHALQGGGGGHALQGGGVGIARDGGEEETYVGEWCSGRRCSAERDVRMHAEEPV